MSFNQTTNRRFVFNAEARFEVIRAAGAQFATLSGYALVWNVLSQDRGGYKVRLKKDSAKFQKPTVALYQHLSFMPLGTTANNTLRIMSDAFGAKVEIDLPATQLGRDVETLVRDKYVTGMSFNMATLPDGRTMRENGVEIFEATSFEVDEVTVCINPAFTESSIGIKPAQQHSLDSHRTRLQKLQLDQFRLTGV